MQEQTEYFLNISEDESKKTDISSLQNVIRYHRKLYYSEESPVISDSEFDELFALLVSLENKYGIQDVTSPTQQVDHLVNSQFSKADHKYPMQSLDNTYDSQDLADFDTRIQRILTREDISSEDMQYIVELKFDGLGVALTYEDGQLVRGVTRGNGATGEDVTINVMQIHTIPKQISCLEPREIRGEIIMPIAEFNELNKKRLKDGEKVFSNPRNAASGSVRQKDPNISAQRPLGFFAYSCPDLEEKSTTYSSLLATIGSYGFELSPFFRVCTDISGVIALIEEEFAGKKPTFPFEIDGLVIKVNNLPLWEPLGKTAHHPRSAISYKFPAEYERTKILSIEQSVGRTGTITPVANVAPVNIGGVIVQRATLHNYDEVKKKGVKIGDHVFIHRAGEVIPEIISPIIETRDGNEIDIIEPTHCPICNTATIKEGEKIALLCPNYNCPAKMQGRLEYFVSRSGLDIDGLGPRQIEMFVEKNWIQDISSIFALPKYAEEMLELEGYKKKSVDNLMESLEKSRTQPIDIFLRSLGIPGVGKRTAKIIGTLFESDANIANFDITYEQLESLPDVGAETAGNVITFFEEHREMIIRLLDQMTVICAENTSSNAGIFSGKSFCVTGSFDGYSRDQIHELIEQYGGEIRSSVSKKLDYLIVGEKAGSKKVKAEGLGVEVWSIDELFTQI